MKDQGRVEIYLDVESLSQREKDSLQKRDNSQREGLLRKNMQMNNRQAKKMTKREMRKLGNY